MHVDVCGPRPSEPDDGFPGAIPCSAMNPTLRQGTAGLEPNRTPTRDVSHISSTYLNLRKPGSRTVGCDMYDKRSRRLRGL